MRVWIGTDLDGVRGLADGGTLAGVRFTAESEDEQDEHDAMQAAVEDGPAVVVAEVAQEDDAVTLAEVRAVHVDTDGSGDLAWFATQEVAAVVEALERRGPA